MSRTSTLIVLGLLTILAPFSGLPMAIRSLLAVIFGAWVLGIGLSLRTHEVHNSVPPATTPPSSVSPI